MQPLKCFRKIVLVLHGIIVIEMYNSINLGHTKIGDWSIEPLYPPDCCLLNIPFGTFDFLTVKIMKCVHFLQLARHLRIIK